jgi:hypothetical protein
VDRTRHDDAVIAEAFDDPAIVVALIELSRTNELAMQAVRWALAFHVQRWHHIMHGDEAQAQAIPEEAPEDVLAALKEALGAQRRP